ncbi:MAG: molecular chaperone HtpG [Bacilli bacterium]|nr:molecular chaperone HtpG [Bacilli bacterium]
MAKKQFKTESKKLMELMINSIYTNKDIFLRELISNASDAIDKLYYNSLTDKKIKVSSDDFKISISIDKDKRLLIIGDNGIGMNKESLEENLGTIARSGSEAFKLENEKKKNIDIIGQFGVGFYSAFMVASKVEVVSLAYGDSKAYVWQSSGIDGYQIKEANKDNYGTLVKIFIKEGEDYDKYLEEYTIESLIKKYSDYITYPIVLKKGEKEETINSLVPLWKRNKNKITDDEYNTFYSDKFFDYDKPLKTIHFKMEGRITFTALLYIPSHAPFDYYSKDYEKGLQLYSNGVLVKEKCKELIPDYYSFVRGVVDSPDLSLNISRETLQQNHILDLISKNIAKKIKKELSLMMENEKDNYEKFFEAFGLGLKAGICNNYGIDKEELQDLLIFRSSLEKNYVTLDDYVSRMKDGQDKIYYACGETLDKIDMLPIVDTVKSKGFEILYLTDYGDEFVFQTLTNYKGKIFANVSDSSAEIDSKEESEAIDKINLEYKGMFDIMKKSLPDIEDIKFTRHLKDHPVCLTSKGVSAQMEKFMSAVPNMGGIKANMILEINEKHPISDKLKSLYETNKDELAVYTKILYAQGRLIEGLSIDNPTELSNLICKELAKDQN